MTCLSSNTSTLILLLVLGGSLLLHSRSSDALANPKPTAARSRREILQHSIALVAVSSITGSTAPAQAVMENRQDVFVAGKDLSVEQAKLRVAQGLQSLDYLLSNWEEIADGGGDNVRRYLGTVGTTSGLYGISKVLKTLQNEADDIVDYTETMNDVTASIQGADGSAYMAIFVVTSTSQTPLQKYFDDAKVEAKRAQKALQELAKQLNIDVPS